MITHSRTFGRLIFLLLRAETPLCSETRTLKVTFGFNMISSIAATTLKLVTK